MRPHKACALLIEVRGREIRTSTVDEKVFTSGAPGIRLIPNAKVFLAVDTPEMPSDGTRINIVNCRDMPRLVKPNDLLYLDDGKIILLVNECDINGVRCEVKTGGFLGSFKGVKLPTGKQEHLPVITPQDLDDIATLIPNKARIDYIALPYAVRKRDIANVRDSMGPTGAHIQILSKIDTVESIHNFEELIKSADGIIINRVELGLEMHAEKLMLAQKWMVDRCCQEGKPCFV